MSRSRQSLAGRPEPATVGLFVFRVRPDGSYDRDLVLRRFAPASDEPEFELTAAARAYVEGLRR